MKSTLLFALAACPALLAACKSTPTEPTHAASLKPPAAIAAPPGYQAIDIGTLGGGSTEAVMVDDQGRVLGTSERPDHSMRAFMWQGGVMRELPADAGAVSYASGPGDGFAGWLRADPGALLVWNNADAAAVPYPVDGVAGQADGGWFVGLDDQNDFFVQAYDTFHIWALVLRSGAWQELGNLNPQDRETQVFGVNGARAVGESLVRRDGPYDITHGFIWEDGVMRDLGQIEPVACYYSANTDCSMSAAQDINDAGVVVGWIAAEDRGPPRAFRWENGVMTDLGVFPGEVTYAVAIDCSGRIAGYGISPAGEYHGWLWVDGAVRDLGSLGGGGTMVQDINDAGDIIGTSLTSSGERHAYVWHDGTMLDLGPGIAVSINQQSDVLVQTWEASNPSRGILFRKLDQPAAVAAR
jgi:probable HAF family extracellular repeat protein